MYVGFSLTALGMFALAINPIAMSAYVWLSIGAGVTGLGIGWSNPATRNAGLQLAPDQSATIAALRTMGMQVGSLTAISLATAILTAFPDGAESQAAIFWIGGLVMLGVLPLVSRAPEHRGAW